MKTTTMKTLHLTFEGLDSWYRPTYTDENGNYWKFTEPVRSSAKQHLEILEERELPNSADSFDGEPGAPIMGVSWLYV